MKDQKLAQLASEYEEAQAAIKAWEATRDGLKEKLVAEMDRRGTTGIVTGGFKITIVAPQVVEYDFDRLKKKLKSKWSLITKEVVDNDKLSAAVQEGEIDGAVVTACSNVIQRAAYPRVTRAEG